MTIIEAIKSGKRFRRPCFPKDRMFEYFGRSDTMTLHDPDGNNDYYYPGKQDILADDWEVEVEEKKVEITREQFKAAHRKAYEKRNQWGHMLWGHQWNPTEEEIAKELGL